MRARRAAVPKLEDANLAGGPQASSCTLIVTEGDSAKALAVSGLSIVGRDRYGVFPLRGKVLNVRDASPAQLAGNDTILALKSILGLRDGACGREASGMVAQ
jgi:DNA topoisomerase-2